MSSGAAAGGGGAAAAVRSGGLHVTTQQIVDPRLMEQPAIVDYDFVNPPDPTFLGCEQRAIAFCWRRFGTSRRSLADCIYGHMVASQILPPQIMALADEAKIDVSGAFSAGASMVCTLPNTGSAAGYPAMIDYF